MGKEPEITAEYKFDGLTLNILYEGGKLVKAATRGDGVTGEEVTAQVKTIAGVPRTISYTGRIEIQGEGIMRLSALAAYNAKSDEPLKNARNGAAGAIRNLDPAVTASRNLSFMAYNIGYSDRHFASQREMHDFLTEEGFETESDFTVLKGADAAFAFAEKVGELRPTLDFLIDGVVFKVNDTALRDEIGYTEKFPKWAIAYKFKADEMTTVLRDVVWQVSRSAKLNPLAVLDPVDIGGVTVRRATLNNYGDILKKKVNRRTSGRERPPPVCPITEAEEMNPHIATAPATRSRSMRTGCMATPALSTAARWPSPSSLRPPTAAIPSPPTASGSTCTCSPIPTAISRCRAWRARSITPSSSTTEANC